MKLAAKLVRGDRRWSHYMATRAILALGSLLSLVLASGAGSHWH